MLLWYYDTLTLPSKKSKDVASSALLMLSEMGFTIPDCDPARGNLLRQPDTVSCGHYVLHYIEEAARHHLGEKKGSIASDRDYRKNRVNAMTQKLTTRELALV